MARLIDIEDERFWNILFDEACVEGQQATRIKNELEKIIAYDVEKVVEQLEEEDRKANQYRIDAIALHNEEFWRGRQTGLLKAIEIVRNGGKE